MKNNLFLKQMSQVLSIYDKKDKEKLFLVALSQVFLAILDLIGVALLGVIGALSVYGIQSKSPGNRINQLLELINLPIKFSKANSGLRRDCSLNTNIQNNYFYLFGKKNTPLC